MIDGLEECDDGNNFSGDGCDYQCLVETYWECFEADGYDYFEGT